MTTRTSRGTIMARRNATIIGVSALILGLLMLYPTSTNSGNSHRRPGHPLAPTGRVTHHAGVTPAPRAMRPPMMVTDGAG